MSCPELASNLTRNYYSTSSYEDGSPINDFMFSNGILLSMCFSSLFMDWRPCTLHVPVEDHIAASWIRHQETGFRIFGVPNVPDPVANPVIGLVLDPLEATIDCFYPTDGATDARLDRGCGPLKPPPKQNSSSYSDRVTRLYWTYELIRFKEKYFPNQEWPEVDCREFLLHAKDSSALQPVFGLGGATYLVDKGSNECSKEDFGLQAFPAEITGLFYLSNQFGRSVCDMAQTLPEAQWEKNNWPIYLGKCIWKPSEWNIMLSSMELLIRQHPKVTMWNEIVVQKQSQRKLVWAVLVLEDNASPEILQLARAEAERLGKPLIGIRKNDDNVDTPIEFHCRDQRTGLRAGSMLRPT